jgi:hypothetical protein
MTTTNDIFAGSGIVDRLSADALAVRATAMTDDVEHTVTIDTE